MPDERDTLIETILTRTLQLQNELGLSSRRLAQPTGYSPEAMRKFLSGQRRSIGPAIALVKAWPQVGLGINPERLAMLDHEHRRMFWRETGERRRGRIRRAAGAGGRYR